MNHIQLLNRAFELIDGDQAAPLSPGALARRLGYSRSYFDGLFMRTVGESLGGYIRRRRLDWAADELTSGQRRIIEVALDAGYDSQEAFTRAFERRYGRTPGEYRRVGRPRVLRPQLSVQPHDKWVGRMRLIMVWHPRLNKEVSA
jgi:AraC-like DNA-binding protein